MKAFFLLALACAMLALAACQPAALPAEPPTTTPEVFIPIDKAIPDYGITLEGVHLQLADARLAHSFPAGCTGPAPCTPAIAGCRMLTVIFAPRDLPQGDMLAYKNLPDVRVALEGGGSVRYSLTQYDPSTGRLSLGFEVPGEAQTFGLHWGDLVEIPLRVKIQE